MKNYYEILEVSQNASKEVIEKAYKVLAKKYHPDLQEQGQKQHAEQKMKLINEAYEILSNDEKRKEHDIEIQRENERIKEIEYQKRQQENLKSKNDNKVNNIDTTDNNLNNISKNTNNEDDNINYEYIQNEPITKQQIKEQVKQEKKIRKQYQEEQERIYRNYMRSLGYRVKERWTLKKFMKLLQAIGIFIVVILIIWFFPPTHKLLVETYEGNEIIKAIVDIIINIIKGFWNGISTFLKSIFS